MMTVAIPVSKKLEVVIVESKVEQGGNRYFFKISFSLAIVDGGHHRSFFGELTAFGQPGTE